MSRKRSAPKKLPIIDPIYKSAIIPKLVNSIMYDGKKTVAEKIVYDALDKLKTKGKEEPINLFNEAILFILPVVIISYYCFSIGGEKNSTFGMKIFKIELVNRKNRKLTTKELLIYNFLFFAVTPIALVLLISFIIPLINDERKCIQDYVFKTKFNSLSKV